MTEIETHLLGHDVYEVAFRNIGPYGIDVTSSLMVMCSRCRGNVQRGAWGAGMSANIERSTGPSSKPCVACGKNLDVQKQQEADTR